MTTTLQTLKDELKEKRGALTIHLYGTPEYDVANRIVDYIITQAFHAGEAKGRNEAVDYIIYNSRTLKDEEGAENMVQVAAILEAARQGDKEDTL